MNEAERYLLYIYEQLNREAEQKEREKNKQIEVILDHEKNN